MAVQGKEVELRQTTKADLADILALWNDGRIMKWVGFPNGLGYDKDNIKDWYKKLQSNSVRHHFVVHKEDVGFCGEVYYSVDTSQGRAGMDIKFTPKAQGKGLATDALKTLIRVVFKSESKVNEVWTEPSADNTAARNLYERCGLRESQRPFDMEQGPSYWVLRREDWDGG